MAQTYGIILAGGLGLRMKNAEPKQFLPLGGMPVIAWSLTLFASTDAIDGIVVVVPLSHERHVRDIAARYRIGKIDCIAAGGATRQESVYRGLKARPFETDDLVIVHDAARPFVSSRCVTACIDAAREHGAAGAYVPVRDTIAEVREGFIVSVPPRDISVAAQTPQGFHYSLILEAHEQALRDGITTTDDVSLVVAGGHPVRVIEGDDENVKITSEHDYHAACAWAARQHTQPGR